MADYIERPAAIESFENGEADVIEDWGDGCAFGFCLETIRDTLNALPAADVAPVVHGRWKRYGRNLGECSNCGEIVNIRYNYCPNCGAKMDGCDDHNDD